ncbi:hypothetical protein Btru_024486 [Bulinus truncatus]|nr:hypothetical protein Btru_024486 [Bulinus truncatus]
MLSPVHLPTSVELGAYISLKMDGTMITVTNSNRQLSRVVDGVDTPLSGVEGDVLMMSSDDFVVNVKVALEDEAEDEVVGPVAVDDDEGAAVAVDDDDELNVIFAVVGDGVDVGAVAVVVEEDVMGTL